VGYEKAGNFEQIMSWYELLDSEAIFNQLITLFENAFEKSSFMEVALVMRSVKAGLYSKDDDLCLKAVKFIERIMLTVHRKEKPDLYNMFQNWFVKVPQTSTKPPESDYANCPLRAVMIALENHSDFAP